MFGSSFARSAESSSGEDTPQEGESAAASSFTTIHRFLGGAGAEFPRGGVALDAGGNVYGTAYYGGACVYCGVIYKLAKPAPGKTAWTYTILHKFGRGPVGADAIGPVAPLTIKGSTIYGTAAAGANASCGCGAVFRLTKSGSGWVYNILHRFDRTQGSTPLGGVLIAGDGTLYGTASAGGAHGAGVVYKITKGGVFSVLHHFAGPFNSGPQGELIFGKDGAIYGTAFGGGKYKEGLVFRITPSGSYSVLYNFLGVNQPGGSHDGAQPEGRLARAADGTIFGTTAFGGTPSGYGTAWSLSPKPGGKWSYTQTYIFGRGANQPNLPHSGLAIDLAGKLYGTGAGGGAFGSGTLYRLSKPASGPIWNLTVLHSFKGRNAGGDNPFADIVLNAGTLYGSTLTGGFTGRCNNRGCGTVFARKL
ncbi:MAG: hypothetical protein L0Y57_06880 [Beijerinckiaceae bacterium]|nr:hypothetical protein [Beijerinckiaceae bacterium]